MGFPEDNLNTKIAVLSTELKSITNKLDTHIEDQKVDIKVLHKLIEALSIKLDNVSKQLDEKYANKWVENVSIGSLISVIAGVVLFFLTKGG
jgi:tRNA A-37 threonylcarbamoyl transferase component Bud32